MRRVFEILLVEDNEGDVRLTREALAVRGAAVRFRVVGDGEGALACVRREGAWAEVPRPDLIILDLNLPGRDGWEVLAVLKADAGLRGIPVVVLTGSERAADVAQAYDLHANCYIIKPLDAGKFEAVLGMVGRFWLETVHLPGACVAAAGEFVRDGGRRCWACELLAMEKQIKILLVEDNPADALLTREALKQGMGNAVLSHVPDGVEAVDFLNRRGRYAEAPRPDLILLDLNLPRKSGREVLAEIKMDVRLRAIPVVILSTSQAADDVNRAYELYANCYVSKPMEFSSFLEVVGAIKGFWGTVAQLPDRG